MSERTWQIVELITYCFFIGVFVILAFCSCGSLGTKSPSVAKTVKYKTEKGCWLGNNDGGGFVWCELEKDCSVTETCP